MNVWSWPDELLNLRQKYLIAEPYPYLVLDGVFPSAMLADVYEDVPRPDSDLWINWGSGWNDAHSNRNEKRGISSLSLLGDSTVTLLQQLNSPEFLSDIRYLTGIPELTGDATFNGGGVHCTGRGGKLRVHVDTVRHPRPDRFDQAANLILFINPDWQPEYGGDLELWSRDGSRKCVQIEPRFNRLVLFHSDRQTYHGHPEPARCPEGLFRTSIATYYYVRRLSPARSHELLGIGWRP